jgi:hypothetical protein
MKARARRWFVTRVAEVASMGVILLIAGCDNQWGNDPQAPFSPVRVMPLGPGQYMVTCVDSPLYCGSQANRSCPAGFDVTSNTTNAADFGRMTMIVRCH